MHAYAAKTAGRSLGLALAGLLIAAAAAQSAEVRVHRGAQVTVESAALQRQKDATGVAVQRGRAAASATAVQAAAGAQPPRVSLDAGEEVWLIDRETGKLVGCVLQKTSTVGRSVIACSKRSLTSILR